MRKLFSLLICAVMILTVLAACSKEHTWVEADCTTPRTCSDCGEVEGEALGHQWEDASCTAPKTCTLCGETEGNSIDHNMKIDGDVYRCSACGKEGEKVFVRLSTEKADAVLEEEFAKFSALITDLTDAIDYWTNNDFTTIEDVRAYEAMWQAMADKASAIETRLTENRPPERYDDLWLELRDCMGEMAILFAKGTNMDPNNDGEYTGDEMRDLIDDTSTELVALFQEAVDIVNRMNEVPAPEESEDDTEPTSGSNSGNKCVECGNSAVRTYTNPFSGELEYYCSKHYEELQDMINDLLGESDSSNSYNDSHDYSEVNSARHDDYEAWSCAQNIVKGNLKSPSTADFCSFTDAEITHLGNGEYMVTGWVDAQNSFGAVIREYFVVTYTATPSGYKNGYVIFE